MAEWRAQGKYVYVLGIDTSTMVCGAAVCRDGFAMALHEAPVRKSHSQTLLPLVRFLLESCRLKLSDIDAFAVSCGPGSFTGLRIGISTVKGLALATGMRAVGVPTLDAIARCAPAGEPRVCSILDARRGEVYAAFYACREGCLSKVTSDQVAPPERLCEVVREPTFFLGDGLEHWGPVLGKCLGGELFRRGDARPVGVASKVAEIGAELLSRWPSGRSIRIVPNYVRRSDAEINRQER